MIHSPALAVADGGAEGQRIPHSLLRGASQDLLMGTLPEGFLGPFPTPCKGPATCASSSAGAVESGIPLKFEDRSRRLAFAPGELEKLIGDPARLREKQVDPRKEVRIGGRFWALSDGDSSDDELSVEDAWEEHPTGIEVLKTPELGAVVPLPCAKDGRGVKLGMGLNLVRPEVAGKVLPWKGPLPRPRRSPVISIGDVFVKSKEGDLGTVSLGILYTSFTLFSVVASPVVTRLGPKRALVVGTSGYVLANLAPARFGTYLTSAALSHARDNSLPEGPTLGKFTGEFWAIFAITQVLGNLLSLALLRNGKCALVTGCLTSGLYSATFIVSAGAVVQATVLFWLLFFYSPIVGMLGAAAPLLVGAFWGVGDGLLNTELNAVLGLLFEDAKEAAFAQFKVWECGAVAVIFFLSPHITLQAMLILMVTALLISFGAFLFLSIVMEKSSGVVRS